MSMDGISLFVEAGKKRTFAGAMDWPGWCRSGRDESAALGTLLGYGARYAQVLSHQGVEFYPPSDVSDLVVVERHGGNATTDFGAPAIMLESDDVPMDRQEFERLRLILLACWGAFDAAWGRAAGRELRKGPRGGGRESAAIVNHVLEADKAYLARLAWKHQGSGEKKPDEALAQIRQAILDALDAAVSGILPKQGPRGGIVWPPRYFVRRVAWHVLDHAWEIEDRIV